MGNGHSGIGSGRQDGQDKDKKKEKKRFERPAASRVGRKQKKKSAGDTGNRLPNVRSPERYIL